ncbi:MAG: HAMP domain-containing sensor histidine kinase [Bacilli bacterium]
MNKEEKRLIIIEISLIITFVFFSILISTYSYKILKEEQIKNNIYVAGALLNKYPYLESDVIDSIIKRTNYEEGYEILKKYNLTDIDSENNNMKTKIIVLNITVLGLLGLFLLLINYLFIKNNYKKIKKIDKYMNNVLNDDYSLDIKDYCEGDISNLKNDVYKMTIKLKEQCDLQQKEKIYLEEMLEDISHQIKTPLTSMYMINDILINEKSLKIKQEFLNKNKHQIERIEWLITSLLKMSRLDSGTVLLKKESVLVNDLVEKALEPIKILIELKNIDLSLDIPDILVNVDINWTSEALLNIIKNACEHTKTKLVITAYTNPLYTQISISDDGCGINKNEIKHIFERFYKGNHNKDSIGIGLNMSKKIINLQNGIIEVVSKESVGSSFIIKLYKNNL